MADSNKANGGRVVLTSSDLCRVFRERAEATHELISYSYSEALGVSEETITDVTLVEMRRQLHPYVIAKKFTKHEESSVSGADWLWTIGRPGRWLSLLIQAKLARPRLASLKGLHHGAGAQRKTLVAYARQQGYVPLYVVYSSFAGSPACPPASPSKKRKPTPQTWSPRCALAVEQVKQMGCVAIRPRHVALMYRSKARREDIQTLLNGGKPWACLFCCPFTSGPKELADAVVAGLGALPMDNPAPRSPGGAKHSEPDDIYESPEALISSAPPAVVAELLHGRTPSHVPFAEVLVISSEPIVAGSPEDR